MIGIVLLSNSKFKIMIKKLLFINIILFTLIFMHACKNDKQQSKEAKETTKKEVKAEDNKGLSDDAIADYIQKGVKIAKASGKTLKGKLIAAVDKGGLQNGINTCNKIAQKLMDSLSTKYNTKIKRTSLKIRNPKDQPSQDEIDVLVQFEKEVKAGKKVKPTAKKLDGGEVKVYIPIMIEKVCLNCHGKIGQELKASTYEVIKKYYPNDEAIDYSEGDLRGIWSITFKK